MHARTHAYIHAKTEITTLWLHKKLNSQTKLGASDFRFSRRRVWRWNVFWVVTRVVWQKFTDYTAQQPRMQSSSKLGAFCFKAGLLDPCIKLWPLTDLFLELLFGRGRYLWFSTKHDTLQNNTCIQNNVIKTTCTNWNDGNLTKHGVAPCTRYL
jgi:hypothetical protein